MSSNQKAASGAATCDKSLIEVFYDVQQKTPPISSLNFEFETTEAREAIEWGWGCDMWGLGIEETGGF